MFYSNSKKLFSRKFRPKTFHLGTLIEGILLNLVWINVLIIFSGSVIRAEDCAPEDCILSPWVLWSDCSHPCGDKGIKSRSRIVLRNATCGGTCSNQITESLPCNRKCCPVDCLFTKWGNWKNCFCNENCKENGARVSCMRKRYKIVKSSCGGTCNGEEYDVKCGQLCCFKNCLESPWTEWGPCIGRCEQKGIQERIKTVIVPPRCGGKPCSDGLEQRECTVACCPVNCSLGEWSQWSACNNTCGQGAMIRSRSVTQGKCGGTRCAEGSGIQSKNCTSYVNVDCVVSPWTLWSDCRLDNGHCGVGKRNRSRSVVTDVGCKGTVCPKLMETMICRGPCCRQDCEVTQWTEWGYCSTDCGTGIRNRTREITKIALCNGSKCPVVMESKPCVVNQTIDCKLTEWSQWSECSNDCGIGERYRSRSLLTPAYCGGDACKNVTLDDKTECTSYRAKKDCKLSEWGNWAECFRNCERGYQKRIRNIINMEVCGGKRCDVRVEVRNCHEKCAENMNCNQGVCSCKIGNYMSKTNGKCYPVICSYPDLKYCPSTHKLSVNCKPPEFSCTKLLYNHNCTAKCDKYRGWILQGSPPYIKCQASGKWTSPQIFCTPPNHPPTGIKLQKTRIPDGSPVGYTVTYMSTDDPDEMDRHTYKIIEDSTARLRVIKNKLVLKKMVDFEEIPVRWNVTISSTDLDNETVTTTFEFIVEDKNDPPSAAFLVPDSIPENSPAGTFVGCLSATDEESNGNVTIVLVDSEHKTFSSYKLDDKICIQVEKISDPKCKTDGGTHCVLNREKMVRHSITVMVTDWGEPRLTSYFDLYVGLLDVNDRPSAILLNPSKIPEENEAGATLAEVVTVDEDEGQTFTLELLDDPSALFSLSGNKLVASKKFDHETEGSDIYYLKIKTTDNGKPPLSFNTTVTVKIGDVNEAPFDLHLTSSNAAVTFYEDKPKIRENVQDVVVGTIVVKDHDKGDHVKLSVPVNAGGRLYVTSQKCSSVGDVAVFCTASLKCSKQFDYEVEEMINISIVAEDRNNLQTSLNLTLQIIDVNDKPKDILVDGNSTRNLYVPENLNDHVVGTLTAEDQDEDAHKFYMVKSAGGRFFVDGHFLKTSPSANLDHERRTEYKVTVMVEDSGSPAMSLKKSFTVHIQDVNEAPTDVTLTNVKISENSSQGSVVGKLNVADPDNAASVTQNFSYDLVKNGKGRFTLDKDTLKVATSRERCGLGLCVLDYETEKRIDIAVNVTDSGSPPLSRYQVITITIEDGNDPPRDIRLVGGDIREDGKPGDIVGQITATEEDSGQSVTFTLLTNLDIFDVKGSNLITKRVLDYEEKSVYNVTIRGTDTGSPSLSTDTILVVEVLDVNEAPAYTGETTLTVRENTAVMTSIGKLKAIDPDNSEKLQITATDDSNQFLVTNTTCQPKAPSGTECMGHLTLAVGLDFQRQSEYNVSVTVQDIRGLRTVQFVTIKVTNDNDPPKDILVDGNSVISLTLSENSQNTVIGRLSAVDPDKQQTHSFSLVSDGDGQFVVSGNKLKTVVDALLDYEGKQEYTLQIKVEDSGMPALSYEKSLVIRIVDVNEKPTKLTLTSSQVEENSAQGTVVGSFQVEDPDNVKATAQTFTFVLVDTAGGRFKALGNELQVARSNADCLRLGGDACDINFESKTSHTVMVQVTDSGVPSKSSVFSLSIQVADANDPPRNIKLSDYKVNSTAVSGTKVGEFSVMDEDMEQTHSYSLTDDSDGLFAVSSSGILTKVKDDALDVKQLYIIKVKVTDDGNSQKEAEETFTMTAVSIEDTNIKVHFTSEGSALTFDPNQPVVKENSPQSTVIGTLVAEENISDQQFVFQIHTKSGGTEVVKLDNNTSCETQNQQTKCRVKVFTTTVLDFEKTPQVTLIVQATRQVDKSVTEVITLKVQDVNEPPKYLAHTGESLAVQENLNGKTLAVFTAYDQDKGDSLKFEMVQDGKGKFILGQNGQLSTSSNANIDYEEVDKVNITVRVTDSGGLPQEKSFTVNILDVNESPTNVTLTKHKVPEMAPVGTEIGTLQASDPDKGQTITYIMLQDAQGRFYIDGNMLKVKSVGDLCVEKGGRFCLLDFETMSKYDIIVKAMDNGTPSLDTTFTLNVEVIDVNDPPTDLTLTLNPLTEDSEINKIVGILKAHDTDNGQTITFSITSSNTTDVFAVEGNKVSLQKTLDFEEQPSYNVTIEAKDSGNPPLNTSRQFTIYILDVNESPTGLIIESKSGTTENFKENQPVIAENKEAGTLIGQLVVHDPDNLDSVKFFTTSADVALFNQHCISLNRGVRCSCDVRSSVVFDFETTPSVQLSVEARDKQSVATTLTVTLTIKDTNDPPTDIVINGKPDTTLTLTEGSQNMTLADLTTSDIDSGQLHSYTLLSNSMAFYISGNQLKVSASAELDYESQQIYQIILRSTDNGQPPYYIDKTVTIQITDVNEKPADVTLSRNQIPEDCEPGFEIGTLVTSDPDNSVAQQQTFVYSLIDSAGDRFTLDGAVLKVNKADFDFETKDFYIIIVRVADSGSPPLSTEVKVRLDVTDANDPPHSLKFTGKKIPENLPVGSEVGFLSAVDTDAGQSLTYSLTSSDYFRVVASIVLVNGPLNYEATSELTFEVKAQDDGLPSLSISKNFTVQVTDEEEPPISLTFVTSDTTKDMKIPEATKIGEAIGHIEALDPDHSDRLDLNLTNNDKGHFELSSPTTCSQLAIDKQMITVTKCVVDVKLLKRLNYEDKTRSQLTFSVNATDQGGESIQQDWTMDIVNSNEPPRDITIDGKINSIPENLPNFTMGALQTKDEDSMDTHVYHVLSHWDIFFVHSNVLKTRKPLDYEKKDKYTVSIKSIDNGIPSMSFVKDFTFNVRNINEEPSVITLSHAEVSNAAAVGDIVGYIAVVDPDNEGQDPPIQKHTCTVGGDGLSVFSVNSTDGKMFMQVAKAIPKDLKLLPIQITCTDNGYPPLSLTVDFNITINETITIPKAVALRDQRSVPENMAENFIVGNLIVVNILNQEKISGVFTFQLPDKDIPFKIVGDELQLAKSLDFEEKSEWDIGVIATGTDEHGNEVNIKTEFSIEVVDVNEAPYGVDIYGGGFVMENSDQGTVIGDLNTLDVEKDQTYTYKIMAISQGLDISTATNDLNGAFQLSDRTLQVGPNTSAINYESSKHMTVMVQTTDSGTPHLSYNGTIHLIVQDTNDAPTQLSLNNTEVAENSGIGTVVGVLSVTDEDKGQSHICHVQNSRDTPFQVVGKLFISVSREELNFEKIRKYAVEIECVDRGNDDSSLSISKTFLIDVTNVNEPPSDLTLTDSNIFENNNVGQVVGEITAADPDGDQVRFTIVGDSAFAIEGDNTLVANKVLDFEVQQEYQVTITAQDTQGLSMQHTFTIKVVNVNEAPTKIQLDHTTTVENLGPGQVIGTLTTVDEDRGQMFVYKVIEMDSNNDYFAVNGDKLVTGKTVLDYEQNSEYHILVNSTDSGTPSKTIQEDFIIKIEDENEPPEGIVIGSLPPIKEDTPVNTALTTIQVDDPDANSYHVCHVTEPLSVVTNEKKEMKLVLAGSVNYEDQAVYSLSLTCSDGRSDITKIVNITIEDVNEIAESIQLSGTGTIVADAEPGYVIGVLTVVDPDLDQKHTFALSGPYSDILKINDKNQLVLTSAIPKEDISQDNPALVVNISATDNGIPSLSITSTFKLPITNIQVVETELPVISLGNTEVTEDAKAGKIIGPLYNFNLTIGDEIEFEIKKNPDGLFNIKDSKYLVLAKNLTEIEGISRKVTLVVRNKETFQIAEKIITVFIVSIDKCRRGYNDTCDENGRCVEVNATFYECQCETGFSGDGYTCENIDDCAVKDGVGSNTVRNPCQNNGECIDEINDFSCICKEGYIGPLCEISTAKPNPCASKPCKNFGSCFPDEKNDQDFQCFCLHGWTGKDCSTNIDDCIDAVCYGGGKCIDKVSTYVCSCAGERYGVRCQYLKSSCAASSCNLNKDELCIPVINRNQGVCALMKLDTVKLRVRKGPQKLDEDEFKAKMMDRLVQFCNRAGPKQAIGRRKRDTTSSNDSVQVFIVSLKETADGSVDIEFIVLDVNDVPYTKQEALNLLVATCSKLKDTENEDKEVCPAVMDVVKKVQEGGSGNEDTGSLVPVIGGAAAGVVVLIIVVVIVIVMKKRKKRDEQSSEEDNGRTLNKTMSEDAETTSRRSSGYASISKAPGTPQLPRSNQGVQEFPHSSHSNMSTDLDHS